MADVAESTVSRALNGRKGVSTSTKKKILKIAKKHNYRPNQLARGLAANKTNMIAVVLSNMDDPGNIEIVKNIENAAEEKNYQVILCNTNQKEKKEKSYLSLLESNQVDGAIFIGGKLVGSHLLKASFRDDNKIVLINRFSEENLIPSVLTDHSQGINKAVDHLAEEGFKDIALICGNSNNLIEEEKIKGYKQALKNNNLSVNDDLIIETEMTRQGGYNAFLKVIRGDVIPDAFISTKELLTVGLAEAIKTGGHFIPEDFALVGYGDNLLTSVIEPPLTVLSEPVIDLGKYSFNFLMKLLNDEEIKEKIKVLSSKLIIRESSRFKFN